MTRQSITSWKTLPPPEQRASLGFAALFDNAEAERLVLGLRPAGMEDKWFICFHQGWLLFHRSWTGVCIYGLQLERLADGVRVAERMGLPPEHADIYTGFRVAADND